MVRERDRDRDRERERERERARENDIYRRWLNERDAFQLKVEKLRVLYCLFVSPDSPHNAYRQRTDRQARQSFLIRKLRVEIFLPARPSK